MTIFFSLAILHRWILALDKSLKMICCLRIFNKFIRKVRQSPLSERSNMPEPYQWLNCSSLQWAASPLLQASSTSPTNREIRISRTHCNHNYNHNHNTAKLHLIRIIICSRIKFLLRRWSSVRITQKDMLGSTRPWTASRTCEAIRCPHWTCAETNLCAIQGKYVAYQGKAANVNIAIICLFNLEVYL